MSQQHPTHIGHIIKKFREKRGMTIAKLSKDSQVSIGFISELENNKQGNPSIGILLSLALAMSTPVTAMIRQWEKELNKV